MRLFLLLLRGNSKCLFLCLRSLTHSWLTSIPFSFFAVFAGSSCETVSAHPYLSVRVYDTRLYDAYLTRERERERERKRETKQREKERIIPLLLNLAARSEAISSPAGSWTRYIFFLSSGNERMMSKQEPY